MKKIKGIIIPLILFIVMILTSYISQIDSDKIYSVGIIIIALYMWIDRTFPISITTAILICLMPFLKIINFNDVILNIGYNTSLFIFASCGLAIAVSNSNIPSYLVNKILKKTSISKNIIIFIGYLITIISGFMSSLATCTLFYGLLSSSFKNIKNTNFYKSLMLLIPMTAGIGGFISPAGTPANILIINELEKIGINITFAKWFTIGFPISLLTTTLVLIFIIFVLKPEKDLNELIIKKDIHLNKKDKYIIIVCLLTILGWFLSSYINFLNTTLVACIGLLILLISKLKVLKINNLIKQTNWDLVVSMGTVSILMLGINKTGVLNEMINYIIHSISSLNVLLVMIIVSIFLCFIRSFIPTTTAVVALFLPALLAFSTTLNINTLILALTLAYHSASALLLIYTEPIYLITYTENVYKEKDLLKVGIIPSLLMSIFVVLLIQTLI